MTYQVPLFFDRLPRLSAEKSPASKNAWSDQARQTKWKTNKANMSEQSSAMFGVCLGEQHEHISLEMFGLFATLVRLLRDPYEVVPDGDVAAAHEVL